MIGFLEESSRIPRDAPKESRGFIKDPSRLDALGNSFCFLRFHQDFSRMRARLLKVTAEMLEKSQRILQNPEYLEIQEKSCSILKESLEES